MRREAGTLGVLVVTDIDAVRDVAARCPCAIELGRIEPMWGESSGGRDAHGICDGLAGQRRFKESRPLAAGSLHRCAHRLVHAHVVRMTVATGRVVSDDDVSILLDEDGGDAGDDVIHGRGCETMGGGAVHAGVGVPEMHDPSDPEVSRGLLDLGPSALGQALLERRGRESGRTVGRDHEHDAVALGRSARHGAGGEQRLIVWVRVHEHERGHGAHPRVGHAGTHAWPRGPK